MKKIYYLAYGSNLNLEQMSRRCPEAKVVGTFVLKDYRLVYKGGRDGYAYLTIEESLGSFVPLGIYEVTDYDIYNLDIYEGYPDFYDKKYITINYNGEKLKALIYIMTPEYGYHRPSEEYVNICINGYNDFGFDVGILDKALTDTIDNIPKNLKKI